LESEFSHAANPGGVAANVGNIRPFAGAKQVER
jgi:hypothetical protein